MTDSAGQLLDADVLTGVGNDWRYAGGTSNANTFGADRLGLPNRPGVALFRNRVYDQRSGRWTQEDPLGVVGGLNLYRYNDNNPSEYRDPFGLQPFCVLNPQTCMVAAGAIISGLGQLFSNLLNRRPPSEGVGSQAAIGAAGGLALGTAAMARPVGSAVLSQTWSAGWGAIEDILRPAGQLIGAAGSSSRVRIVQGTLEDAKDLFTRLSEGGTVIRSGTYPGTLMRLSTGTIGLRPVSGSGPPTIDINIAGIGITEIKFVAPGQ